MSSPERNNTATGQTTEPSAPTKARRRAKQRLTVRETVVFSMLGSLMFCSKLLLEWAPNIHLLALFIIVFTRVYRAKALLPIYVFVLLSGLYMGFHVWWLPYLYAWTLLWAAVMLLPRRLPNAIAAPVFVVLAALHGLLFGTLCAPVQALAWGLSFKATLAWIAAGLYFDLAHAVGNAIAATLALPLIRLLTRLEARYKS